MKVKTIPSGWLRRDGARLDCSPYMSGALEAKVRLEQMDCLKQPLGDLTAGHQDGIYNGPQFKRNYVDDPEHGVPFLGSASMLAADLSNLPLLRKKDAYSKKLAYLRVRPGMTMISCSGTIGRMVFARPDMDGMWSSQDILKVVPDPDKIPPGYLYAYLSSKFGVPLVVSGTYGAIIQHIEPSHIADLPVPRLGSDLENAVHELVEEAGRLRSDASLLLKGLVKELEVRAGLPPLPSASSPSPASCTTVDSRGIQRRFDAFFHSPYHEAALTGLASSATPISAIRDLAKSVVEPHRFKRIKIDNTAHGIRFFGTTALLWAEPVESYYLPKKQSGINQYLVDRRTILVPRSGQLSGLIGTAVLPHGDVIGGGVSEDAIRIHCDCERMAGYLYVALTSEYGLRQLKARAFGSSIPHLDIHQIREVMVPRPTEALLKDIGEQGVAVSKMRDEAVTLERDAKRVVENKIGEVG